jgi:uncharacterized membrane protein HdeD (DUF308 family)
MSDKRCSVWHLVSGIVMVILGLLIWANPLSSLYAMAIYLGAVMFVLGCGYVAFSFSQYSGWYLVVGLLDIFVGLIFLTHLGLTVQTLPIIFALWFLATGTMQISAAFDIKKIGLPWIWSMISGLLGVALAFFVLVYQNFGEYALVLTIGFYVVAYGLLSIGEYFYFSRFCRQNMQKKIDA